MSEEATEPEVEDPAPDKLEKAVRFFKRHEKRLFRIKPRPPGRQKCRCADPVWWPFNDWNGDV